MLSTANKEVLIICSQAMKPDHLTSRREGCNIICLSFIFIIITDNQKRLQL